MNKDEFDQLFDEAFENAVKSTDDIIPDHRTSWNKVNTQIKKEQRKRVFRRRIRSVSTVVASMLLGAIILGNTSVTNAFNPFYLTLKEMPGQFVSFFAGNQDHDQNDAKTNPPTDGKPQENNINKDIIGETYTVTVSLEEARKQVAFKLPNFGYTPTGYELKQTELFFLPEEDLSKKVRITFKDQNDDSLRITFTQLQNDTAIGSGANKAEIEEVQLKNGKGYLAITANGSSKLEFLQGNAHVMILGSLSKEEIIRFAENM